MQVDLNKCDISTTYQIKFKKNFKCIQIHQVPTSQNVSSLSNGIFKHLFV